MGKGHARRGLKPDVAAPGVSIPSTQSGITCTAASQGCIVPSASGFIPGGQVLVLSGTSMATPHTAGTMALLKQLHPDWSVEELKASVMNGAVHDLTVGVNHSGNRFGLGRIGAGRIDVASSAINEVRSQCKHRTSAIVISWPKCSTRAPAIAFPSSASIAPLHSSVHVPVGPKRSVLTRRGSCPSATSDCAAASTNPVGPQM